jgi:hypothetical protein
VLAPAILHTRAQASSFLVLAAQTLFERPVAGDQAWRQRQGSQARDQE